MPLILTPMIKLQPQSVNKILQSYFVIHIPKSIPSRNQIIYLNEHLQNVTLRLKSLWSTL